MFSISTFPKIIDIGSLAEKYDIQLETTKLISIGEQKKEKLDEHKNDPNLNRYRSAHGPFFDLIPATSDSELRELVLRRFKRTVEWCSEMKIKNIVFHTGWLPKTYPDDVWIHNSQKFWTELLQEIDPSISIHIENVYEDHPVLLKELIDRVDKKNFTACLDIGHVNANSTKGIELWLKELGLRVGHIHIHNNEGKTDDHFGLTKGMINFPGTFDMFMKYCPNAYWNLEILTNIEESIEMSKKYIESTT